MNTKTNYNFIQNNATGEDLFKNKSQEKIAEVIRTEIIDNEKFQIIGIDGEWGAGKSNLVRLLASKLDDNYIFFTYDVWGHQEDDQRRSILVELTEELSIKKVLKNKSDWEDRLKKLLGKEREVTTINRPYLGLGVIFTLFAIIYTPLITTFKSDFEDTVIFNITVKKLLWQLAFICLPLFIILTIYLYNLRNCLKSEKLRDALKNAFYKTYQVYTNKQIDETKIETISEKNPSVKDFTNWINDINTDLEDKKLIIVFDNFDRLPKKHIANLWSSIHIFFAEKIDQKTNNNIKVILPFDRAHILDAFNELNSSNQQSTSNNKGTYAHDYINKTFDIVFRVSLPLMSDWKTFFEDKWKEAFPNEINRAAYFKVLEIYEFLNRKITPREIIAFINDIVSIKLLDADYEFPYIAIFSLCKDKILENTLDSLVELNYLGGLSEQYKNDDKYSSQITAIVYQIKPDERAIELIYTHQLRDALQNNDVILMNKICKTDFGDHIIKRALSELKYPTKAIETFYELSADSSLSDEVIKAVWSKLYFQCYTNSENDFGVYQYQHILLEKCSNQNQYIKILLENLRKHNEFFAPTYAQTIQKLANDYPSLNPFELLEVIEVDINPFLDIVKDYPDYKKFNLSIDGANLDHFLTEKDLKYIYNLSITKTLITDFDLPLYRKLLLDKYADFGENKDYEYTALTLQKLKEFRESGKLDQEPVLYLKDYKIYNLLVELDSQDDSDSGHNLKYDLIAMALVSYTKISSTYKNSISRYFDDFSEIELEKITNSILYYISFGDLLLLCKSLGTFELYHKIINYAIQNELSLRKELELNVILPHFDMLMDSLKDDGINLEVIERYNKTEFNLANNQISVRLLESCFGDYPDLVISKQILDRHRDYYSNLDIGDWREIFENENDPYFEKFHYVSEQFNNNAFLAWYPIFQQKLVKKEELSDGFLFTIDYALNKKEEVAFRDFLKGLKNAIYKDMIVVDVFLFNTFYSLFKEYRVFEEDPSDVFRTFFKSSNMSHGKIESAICKDIEYLRNLYNAVDDESKKSFKLYIRENANGNENLEFIAKTLKISVKRKDKEHDGSK